MLIGLWAERCAGVHMKVKVLRVLIPAEVRQHSASPVLSLDRSSDLPHDGHDIGQKVGARVTEIG